MSNMLKKLALTLMLALGAEDLGGAPAHAYAGPVVVDAVQSSAAAKAKRKRRRPARPKPKKPAETQTPAPPPAAEPSADSVLVAVLPFEGDSLGATSAQALGKKLVEVDAVDALTVDSALAPGNERFSEASVKTALQATKTDALVRAVVSQEGGRYNVDIYAYADDGKVHFAQRYTSEPGRDLQSLNPVIARELDGVLPKLESSAVVNYDSQQGTGDGDGGATDNPVFKVINSMAKAEGRVTPLLSVSAGPQLLYWSYDLQSKAMKDTIFWNPLEPFLALSLDLAVYPIEYAGAFFTLDVGHRSYAGDLPIEQKTVGMTALALNLGAAGHYNLPMGFGVGGHLGYRYFGGFADKQTPLTIIPGFGAHLLAPGLEVTNSQFKPWLTGRLGFEFIPFGLYSESPDSPGDPKQVSLLGWQVDGTLRSTFYMGIFAELHLYYALYYATYKGMGDRINSTGTALTDAAVVNGVRGLSLGLGWSY